MTDIYIFFSLNGVIVTSYWSNFNIWDPFADYIQYSFIIIITVLHQNTQYSIYYFIAILDQDMSAQIKLLDNQVSGKTAKFTDNSGKYVYKKLSQKQFDFYLFMEGCSIFQGEHHLKNYIPKFIGKIDIEASQIMQHEDKVSRKGQWINHISDRNKISKIKQCIVLQNLLEGYKNPCVMDIKLGQKKEKKDSNKKFQTSTTNSHNFRINGMSTTFIQKQQHHFISKYYFQKTIEQQIQTHLAFFFFDGNRIDLDLIKKCVEEIKDIVLALTCFNAGSFDSASLLIVYDASSHIKFKVKIIDFDKYYASNRHHENGDSNIILGLKYIIWYLNNIEKGLAYHQQLIKNQKIKIFDHFDVVPPEKLAKFNSHKLIQEEGKASE